MTKKHFPTRLYCIFIACHILSTCQVENIVGKLFFFFFLPNITQFWETTFSINHSYPDTSQNVSIVQVSKKYPPWSYESTLRKNCQYITKVPGSGIVSADFSCRCLTQPSNWLCFVRGKTDVSCNSQARHLRMVVSWVYHTQHIKTKSPKCVPTAIFPLSVNSTTIHPGIQVQTQGSYQFLPLPHSPNPIYQQILEILNKFF